MKQRVAEMEREAEKLRELQAAAESASTREGSEGAAPSEDDKTVVDGRSVFVGNVRLTFAHFLVIMTRWLTPFFCVSRVQVDYSATPEELQGHFQSCGTINRITILCDKFTGHPKGSVKASHRSQCYSSYGYSLGLPTSNLQSPSLLMLQWHWTIRYSVVDL